MEKKRSFSSELLPSAWLQPTYGLEAEMNLHLLKEGGGADGK